MSYTISSVATGTGDNRIVTVTFDPHAGTDAFTVTWGFDTRWNDGFVDAEGSRSFFLLDAAIAFREAKLDELIAPFLAREAA